MLHHERNMEEAKRLTLIPEATVVTKSVFVVWNNVIKVFLGEQSQQQDFLSR